jgi:hypothetical protein
VKIDVNYVTDSLRPDTPAYRAQFPNRLEIELGIEDMRRMLDFWRYIRDTAAGGHSFVIEADREDFSPSKNWKQPPRVSIDGDGADRIGRIFLNGKDVTKESK